MTNEEAIRYLSVHLSTNGSGLCSDEQHYEAKQVAIQALEQTRWIPASKRLPEEETDVLICNVNKDIAISRGSYSTEMKNEFIWYTSGWRFGKVTAWMPLPESYKGE